MGKGMLFTRFLNENPNTDEAYYKVRDQFKVETPLDNAKRFFYLRKTCFRGMLRYNKSGKLQYSIWPLTKRYNYEELER